MRQNRATAREPCERLCRARHPAIRKSVRVIRFLITYDTPADPEAFDRHYHEMHAPLARRLPGVLDYTVVKTLGRSVAPRTTRWSPGPTGKRRGRHSLRRRDRRRQPTWPAST